MVKHPGPWGPFAQLQSYGWQAQAVQYLRLPSEEASEIPIFPRTTCMTARRAATGDS